MVTPEPITDDLPMLGRCPDCQAPIPRSSLLIEYRTDRGWPAMFAECPRCLDVVHPT